MCLRVAWGGAFASGVVYCVLVGGGVCFFVEGWTVCVRVEIDDFNGGECGILAVYYMLLYLCSNISCFLAYVISYWMLFFHAP